MASSDDSVTTMLETRMTNWPKTLKEIDRLIKLAENHIDDLSIEIGAARVNVSEDLPALLERNATVVKNLEGLQAVRDSRRGKNRKRPAPATTGQEQQIAKRTRSATTKGSLHPPPDPTVARSTQGRSAPAKGARKRVPSPDGGDGGDAKRVKADKSPDPSLNASKSNPPSEPPTVPKPATKPPSEPPTSPKPVTKPPSDRAKSPDPSLNASKSNPPSEPPTSPKPVTKPPSLFKPATKPPSDRAKSPDPSLSSMSSPPSEPPASPEPDTKLPSDRAKSPDPSFNSMSSPPSEPPASPEPDTKPPSDRAKSPVPKLEEPFQHPLNTEGPVNPWDMEGLLQMSEDDEDVPRPPEPPKKPTKAVKAAKKPHKKAAKTATKATAEPDQPIEDVVANAEGTSEAKTNGGKPTKSSKSSSNSNRSSHHPGIYANLTELQRNSIHQEVDDNMQRFLLFNVPFSNNARTWVRRGADVLPIAASHSMKLAASMLILTNGRTACPFHCIHKEPKPTNVETEENSKVTGTSYLPNKKVLQDPSYLDRPSRVDSRGIERPARPHSYNPNFTLERTLEFFISEPEGVRRLHCGCVLEDVLLEFSFWKRTIITSASLGFSHRMDSPLWPRDRLYLNNIVDHLHFSLDNIYHYDTEGKRVSREKRLIMWANKIWDEVDKLRGEGDENRRGAGNGASSSKRALTYVEIPDGRAGTAGGSGRGLVSSTGMEGYEMAEETGGKGKGKAPAVENLFSDSDSDASVQSPSFLYRTIKPAVFDSD